ncbi:peptidase M4 [Geobacillus sp. 44B]|nr:peptidase M4 [Geobacillus sp. 44B]
MAMRKWTILLFIFLCLAIWQAVSVYQDALWPKQSMEAKALERAKEKVAFAQIDRIYTYHGEEAYIVFVGKTKKGKKYVVWVPEKKGKIVIKRAESGITEAEAIAALKAERHPKKIISARLGMEKGVPLWELTYIDQYDRYSFYYVSFTDGTFLKRYSFQQ